LARPTRNAGLTPDVVSSCHSIEQPELSSAEARVQRERERSIFFETQYVNDEDIPKTPVEDPTVSAVGVGASLEWLTQERTMESSEHDVEDRSSCSPSAISSQPFLWNRFVLTLALGCFPHLDNICGLVYCFPHLQVVGKPAEAAVSEAEITIPWEPLEEAAPPLPAFVNELSAETLQAMLANPHLLSQVKGGGAREREGV
jgi:hypothetical protein